MRVVATFATSVTTIFVAISASGDASQSKTAADANPPAAAWTIGWRIPMEFTGSPWLAASTTTLWLASADGGVIAFAGSDGKELWRSPTPAAVSPAFGRDLLVVASEGSVRALHAASGRPAWEAAVPSSEPVTRVAYIADMFLAVAGCDVHAWKADGTAAWTRTLDAVPATRFTVVRDAIVVGTEAPALVAIDVASGTIRLRSPLPSPPRTLTTADSEVFLTADDGVLYSYEVRDEIRQSWKHPRIRTRGLGDPAVDDDRVYVTLVDNTLRAFSRDSGSQKWSHDLPSRPAIGPVLGGLLVLVPLTDGTLAQALATTGGRNEGTAATSAQRVRLHAVAAAPEARVIFGLIAGDGVSEIVAWRPKN